MIKSDVKVNFKGAYLINENGVKKEVSLSDLELEGLDWSLIDNISEEEIINETDKAIYAVLVREFGEEFAKKQFERTN